MTLPFDSTQFFAVFARYNAAVWPAQIFLTVLAVVAIGLALRRRGWSDRVVGGVLGLFWVWMGVVYHWMFFRAINPAATLFGVLFVLEGIALVALGAVRRRLRFRFRATLQGLAGALLLAYALVAYPLLGHAADHRYPAMSDVRVAVSDHDLHARPSAVDRATRAQAPLAYPPRVVRDWWVGGRTARRLGGSRARGGRSAYRLLDARHCSGDASRFESDLEERPRSQRRNEHSFTQGSA